MRLIDADELLGRFPFNYEFGEQKGGTSFAIESARVAIESAPTAKVGNGMHTVYVKDVNSGKTYCTNCKSMAEDTLPDNTGYYCRFCGAYIDHQTLRL